MTLDCCDNHLQVDKPTCLPSSFEADWLIIAHSNFFIYTLLRHGCDINTFLRQPALETS